MSSDHGTARGDPIVSDDLHTVLTILYEAGARHVPAAELDWPEELGSTVFHALNMLYVTKRDTGTGREFSLTRSGFRAIGKEPPRSLSVLQFLRSLFGRGGST